MKIHVSNFTSPQCTCMYVCKVNRLRWGTCTFTTGWSVYEPCQCMGTLKWSYDCDIHCMVVVTPPPPIDLLVYVHGSQGDIDKEWKTYSSLKPIIHMHASACVLWPHAMWYQCKAIAIAFCIYIYTWLTPLRNLRHSYCLHAPNCNMQVTKSMCVLRPHTIWYQYKAIAIVSQLHGWPHHITGDVAIACPQLQPLI